MKNAAKVFNKWFWSWVAIATVLLAVMLLLGNENNEKTAIIQLLAGMILALFMVMPIRDWTYRLAAWAFDYVSSIDTTFKDRVNQHATYNRLINPLVREENVGFYRLLKFAVNLITLILALTWLVLSKTSFRIVYAFVHTWEFIFRGEVTYVALLLYAMIKAAFFYTVFWFFGHILGKEKARVFYNTDGSINWGKSWWKIVLIIVVFYVHVICGGLLMKYTSDMLWHKVLFWTISAGLPILIIEISRLVGVYKKRRATP